MKSKVFLGSALISLATILSVASPAFAWHPQGYIKKQVQNQTANSALADADTVGSAVTAKPGDILVYTFTVGNKGSADDRGYNDMANTVLTDTLPNGVELVSNATERTVTLPLGTIKPQASVTKTVTVKVTSTTDGAVIDNEACFTGNSTANDNAQSGCDKAIVKVSVPVAPKTPTPPAVTPPTVQGTTVVKTLPKTGPSNALAIALVTSVLGYVGSLIVQSKRSRVQSL